MMSAAVQKSIGGTHGTTTTFARFDWDNRITVKLDFADLSKILQVLRGECESLEEGRGLYHRTVRTTTRIVFRHLLEPVIGYSLELYRSNNAPDGSNSDVRTHIIFTPWEALGLCESIAGAMHLISFGLPMVIPHDTSACEAEQKEVRYGRIG